MDNLHAIAKEHVNKFAAFLNVGKAELVQAALKLRADKFAREQAQFKHCCRRTAP